MLQLWWPKRNEDIYTIKHELTAHDTLSPPLKGFIPMRFIAHARYTDIVLNTLKPDRAVETITPGICGCQWTSLTSV